MDKFFSARSICCQELDSDLLPLFCAGSGARVSGLMDTQRQLGKKELKLKPIINPAVRAATEQSGGILVSFSDLAFSLDARGLQVTQELQVQGFLVFLFRGFSPGKARPCCKHKLPPRKFGHVLISISQMEKLEHWERNHLPEATLKVPVRAWAATQGPASRSPTPARCFAT